MSVGVQSKLSTAREMLNRDASLAAQLCEQMIADGEAVAEARIILSEALRRQGRLPEARKVAEAAVAHQPMSFDPHRQLGVILGELGDAKRAGEALAAAGNVIPAHPTIWRELAEQSRKAGDEAQARLVSARHNALEEAARAMQYGDAARAQLVLSEYLLRQPEDIMARRVIADAYLAHGQVDAAEEALRECLKSEPEHIFARRSLVRLLNRQSRYQEALEEVRLLLEKAPGEEGSERLLASTLVNLGAYDEALQIYQQHLSRNPAQPEIWTSYGHVQRTLGAYDEAVRAYRQAISYAPNNGDAHWFLANLKAYTFSQDERAQMEEALRRTNLSRADRVAFHYALGKSYEDSKDYDVAWSHFQGGAQLQKAASGYNAAATSDAVSMAIRRFTSDFLTPRLDAGAHAEDPIFILGLPRSGSTLVEQILASHSSVEGTLELPDLPLTARELAIATAVPAGGSYLDALDRAEPALLKRLGERYLAATQIRRRLGRAFFIDKQPANWIFVGLIALILPRAKIIDARREPLSCCLSCFKQLFAGGQGFSYGLKDLGAYYYDYVRLMRHWDQVLPGRIHRVIYDDLVVEPENAIRDLLEYCGLPFEPQCLTPHRTERAVHTASSEQVRRPISTAELHAYRPYEPWVDELKESLGHALAGWR